MGQCGLGLGESLPDFAPCNPVVFYAIVVEDVGNRGDLTGRSVEGSEIVRDGRDHGFCVLASRRERWHGIGRDHQQNLPVVGRERVQRSDRLGAVNVATGKNAQDVMFGTVPRRDHRIGFVDCSEDVHERLPLHLGVSGLDKPANIDVRAVPNSELVGKIAIRDDTSVLQAR